MPVAAVPQVASDVWELFAGCFGGVGGAGTGYLAEYCACGEPGASWVVVVEEAAHKFAGCEEAGEGDVFFIEDAALVVYLEAAEGEGDAAGDGVAQVGGRVDGQGPVGLGGLDALGVLSVEDGGVVLISFRAPS